MPQPRIPWYRSADSLSPDPHETRLAHRHRTTAIMLSDKTPGQRKAAVLSLRLQLVFSALTILPVALIAVVVVHDLRGAYHQRVDDHLSVLLGNHSKRIDNFLEDRLGNIRTLARWHTVDELSSEAFLREKLSILREEYGGGFVDLGLIDPDGVQQAYSGPFNLSKANYAGTTWFSELKKTDHYVSDVFTGLRGTPHFIIAVKKPWQGKDWIIRSTIDFQAFSALVTNIRMGQTGFAFILNRSGELQTKPQREVIASRGPYAELVQRELEPGKVLIEERDDALGNDALIAVSPLNGGRWLLCYDQQTSDAYASLNDALLRALYLLLAFGVAVNLVAFVLIRRMARRIAVSESEKQIMRDEVVEAGRLASIGELAAGIAHEINNPVAIMVEEAGWIDDILGDDDATSAENLAEITRAVGQIRTQGGRCKEITHKLLSFARKTDPNVKDFQLNELIEEVLGLLGQKTRYSNIEVITLLDESLPREELVTVFD
jgi:two-component system NtrC family sensor kinase